MLGSPVRPLLPIDVRDPDAIRRRLRDRERAGDHDGAAVLSDVLASLGEASATDVARARAVDRLAPRAPLDARGWARLRHPSFDPALATLFDVLSPPVLAVRGKTDRDAGLHAKHLVDPARSTVTLARTFGFAASLLGVPAPRLYLRQDVQGGLGYVPVFPLASLAGSTLLTGFDTHALRFVCGAHLSYYGRGGYLLTLCPSWAELAALMRALLVIDGVVAPDARSLAVARELLPRLPPLPLEAAHAAILRLRVPDVGSLPHALELAVRAQRRALWLTSHRVGLLLTGRLAPSIVMLRALGAYPEMDATDTLDHAEHELRRFAVSERYVAIRRALREA